MQKALLWRHSSAGLLLLFNVDPDQCYCRWICLRADRQEHQLKDIAAILEQPVIEKILARLGPQARALLSAPAQGQALQAA